MYLTQPISSVSINVSIGTHIVLTCGAEALVSSSKAVASQSRSGALAVSSYLISSRVE